MEGRVSGTATSWIAVAIHRRPRLRQHHKSPMADYTKFAEDVIKPNAKNGHWDQKT